MPAKSVAQRKLMAIAEHDPDELNPANKGVLDMSHSELHAFAATPEKNLPKKVKHAPRGRKNAGKNKQFPS